MQWHVHISYPAGQYDGANLSDDEADRLAGANSGPVSVNGDLKRVTFTRTVHAKTVEAAVKTAVADTKPIAETVGLEPVPTAVEAEPWADVEARISLAPLGLVGMAEVAEILEVSRQRAHEIAKEPGFPEPLPLAAGAVYKQEGVERFAATRNRSRGRPRKAT